MTAKEKAKELFDKMCQTISSGCENESYCQRAECKWKGITYCTVAQNEAKQGALIAVDEVMAKHYDDWDSYSEWWQEVKEELEKL